MPTLALSIRTMRDLQQHLWGIPPQRIRLHPSPGTATLQDVLTVRARENRSCELVDGMLVEKTVGFSESQLTCYLIFLLNQFVLPRNLGVVTGEDGAVELLPDRVRIPDVAFFRWDRFPGKRRPLVPVPQVAPDLAVEILSLSNTAAEMAAKRQDYFAAGVQLVWEIEPEIRTVAVYTTPTDVVHLGSADTLEGGQVLPGFSLPLSQLFAELDRQG